ncbi:succinate dehydrogenase/fumarate reductase cytochrome b subunit [Providencia alcalifaciens]|nr:succinate dehydrogenase/fumarate reductase cytochrome b subunit [Providencia alcalifaciens]
MKVLLVRKMAELHRTTGAFLGIFLFVIMLSGSWSLGSDALRLWWNKAPLSGEFYRYHNCLHCSQVLH